MLCVSPQSAQVTVIRAPRVHETSAARPRPVQGKFLHGKGGQGEGTGLSETSD